MKKDGIKTCTPLCAYFSCNSDDCDGGQNCTCDKYDIWVGYDDKCKDYDAHFTPVHDDFGKREKDQVVGMLVTRQMNDIFKWVVDHQDVELMMTVHRGSFIVQLTHVDSRYRLKHAFFIEQMEPYILDVLYKELNRRIGQAVFMEETK